MQLSWAECLVIILVTLAGTGTIRLFATHNQGSPWADGLLLLTG